MNGRLQLLAIGAPLALLGVWPLTAMTLSAEPDVIVVAQGEQVCSGTHIDPAGEPSSVTITAPEGQLISAVCVKAGSAVQGDGPEYFTYSPPVESVTISHSSGKGISHYSVTYVPVPTTTAAPSTTLPPPPTTLPATTTTLDRCPPELEPCTPGTQTTIPGTTTTTAVGATTTSPNGTTTTVGSTTTTTSQAGTATSAAPPPTTVPLQTLDIGSAASVCSRDVPYVDITFGDQPELNGIVGTITFQTLDGTVIEVHEVTYQAGSTVRLLYPGASIDPVTGEATDWPGWVLNADGFWVLDPSDAEFRDGLIIVAEINPTATTTISYPPETAACNSPAGPFPPGQTVTAMLAGDLPATGNSPWLPTIIGAGVGALGLGIGLRRRFG